MRDVMAMAAVWLQSSDAKDHMQVFRARLARGSTLIRASAQMSTNSIVRKITVTTPPMEKRQFWGFCADSALFFPHLVPSLAKFSGHNFMDIWALLNWESAAALSNWHAKTHLRVTRVQMASAYLADNPHSCFAEPCFLNASIPERYQHLVASTSAYRQTRLHSSMYVF